MWESIIAVVLPWFEIILAAFAAKYIAEAVAGGLAKGLVGITDVGAKLNQNKYLKIMQFDDWLIERTRAAVEAVNDSYVAALKEASKDGKLTTTEAKEATAKAYQLFKDSLTKVEWAELQTVIGDDVATFVKAKIPGIVAALKPFKKVQFIGEVLSSIGGSEDDTAPLPLPSLPTE